MIYPVAPRPAAAQLIDISSAVRDSSLPSDAVCAQQVHLFAAHLVDGLQAARQAAPELREALGDACASRDAQDHLAGEPVFALDLREDRLAHGGILDQAGVLARDRQIDLQQRALDVVENQPEQPGLAEHALEQLRVRAPCARPERP